MYSTQFLSLKDILFWPAHRKATPPIQASIPRDCSDSHFLIFSYCNIIVCHNIKMFYLLQIFRPKIENDIAESGTSIGSLTRSATHTR